MTNKEMRLREAKLYQGLMNEILTGKDPEVWIDRHGIEMSLGIAMYHISEYIDACFWLDDNPLRHLRKQFPSFIWKFHKNVNPNKLAPILVCADYIWVTGLEVGDEFVTATQIEREKPRVLCFLPEKNEYSGWNNMIRKRLNRVVPDIRFIKNGDDRVANTIII